jgi:hypothetical protein
LHGDAAGGALRTGATFREADAEFMPFLEEDRDPKPSTLRDSDSVIWNHPLPAFGDRGTTAAKRS